jgi:hypothetical protein
VSSICLKFESSLGKDAILGLGEAVGAPSRARADREGWPDDFDAEGCTMPVDSCSNAVRALVLFGRSRDRAGVFERGGWGPGTPTRGGGVVDLSPELTGGTGVFHERRGQSRPDRYRLCRTQRRRVPAPGAHRRPPPVPPIYLQRHTPAVDKTINAGFALEADPGCLLAYLEPSGIRETPQAGTHRARSSPLE